MDQADDQFPLGQAIPGTPYRVRSLIGAGGMGSVYEVEHQELGKLFVLKALRGRLADRTDLAARMKNEWSALARLQHPNIVLVTDAGRTQAGVPYYVMERLEGETLSARLRREGRLSVPVALQCCAGILDGLAAAHAINIVHRDIKPQNVFLPAGGGVKLLDFGIAKLRDQATKVVTRRGVAIGTPKYMSPEQAEGKAVDGRADIYAVALVLFELLAGRGPFARYEDPNDLVLAHMMETPPRLDRKARTVPEEVADLVQRWLSKDPANRPPDASIAAREIRRLASSLGAESSASTLPVTVPVDYDSTTLAADSGDRGAAKPSSSEGAFATTRRENPPVRNTPEDGPTEALGAKTTLGDVSRTAAEDADPGSPTDTPPGLSRHPYPDRSLSWSRWVGLAALVSGLTVAALLVGIRLGASMGAPEPPTAPVQAAGEAPHVSKPAAPLPEGDSAAAPGAPELAPPRAKDQLAVAGRAPPVKASSSPSGSLDGSSPARQAPSVPSDVPSSSAPAPAASLPPRGAASQAPHADPAGAARPRRAAQAAPRRDPPSPSGSPGTPPAAPLPDSGL